MWKPGLPVFLDLLGRANHHWPPGKGLATVRAGKLGM